MSSSTTRRAARWAVLALLPVVLLLGWTDPASAHPYLLASAPAVGSVKAAAPASLLLSFTEALDRSYTHVVLVGPDGGSIGTTVRQGGPPTAVEVVPNHPLLQKGTYAVEWTAVGVDGHTVTGAYPISLGRLTANVAVADASLSGSAGLSSTQGLFDEPLRVLLPLLTVLLVGALLFQPVLHRVAARRTRQLRDASIGGLLVAVVGLLLQQVAVNGTSSLATAGSSRRLLAQAAVLLLLLTVPALGARAARPATLFGAGLLVVLLAASGHVQSQPGAGRLLVLLIYSAHLTAVSAWLGALVLALLGFRSREVISRPRMLRIVGGSLVVLLATGVLLTSWALRGIGQLATTGYGRIIDLKVVLLLVAVGAGAVALKRQTGRRMEAGLALAALVAAGLLGQQSLPIDLPQPSQVFAEGTGLPVSVAVVGNGLITGVLTPGVVGANTLLVRVTRTDAQDFQQPVTGLAEISAQVSCSCAQSSRALTLHPVADSPWWATNVDLPIASTWSFSTRQRVAPGASASAGTAVLNATVLGADLPDQVVVGVAADLSGPLGQQCDDQVLGLQAAFADVNRTAADHGRLVRVVAVDLHGGAAPEVGRALSRLRSLGATSLAVPCGSSAAVQGVLAGAHDSGVPVLSATGGPGAYSVTSDWTAEGKALGQQARTQQMTDVTVVVGTTAADLAELRGLGSQLPAAHVVPVPADPTALTARLATGVDGLVLLTSPSEALPLVQRLGVLNQDEDWAPRRGLLASAQLMDTDFINAAGHLTRTGTIEFASDVNPFDPMAQYYAQRLRQLTPGIRPTFNGLHGYQVGVLLARALHAGGGHPSSARLLSLLSGRFADTTLGSSTVHWTTGGGGASSVAFFRSTYVSPMAASPLTPGGATSLDHEGTFLNAGGFVQISPFRKLA